MEKGDPQWMNDEGGEVWWIVVVVVDVRLQTARRERSRATAHEEPGVGGSEPELGGGGGGRSGGGEELLDVGGGVGVVEVLCREAEGVEETG